MDSSTGKRPPEGSPRSASQAAKRARPDAKPEGSKSTPILSSAREQIIWLTGPPTVRTLQRCKQFANRNATKLFGEAKVCRF